MSIFIKNALLNGKKQNILIEDNLISYIGKDKQEITDSNRLALSILKKRDADIVSY